MRQKQYQKQVRSQHQSKADYLIGLSFMQSEYLNKKMPQSYSLQLVESPSIEKGWKNNQAEDQQTPLDFDQSGNESEDSINPIEQAIPGHLLPMYGLLRALKLQCSSVLFLYPVNPYLLGIPDYHKIILKPMDLSTIECYLRMGMYGNEQQFHDDIELMISNSLIFNSNNFPILSMTYKFQKQYQALKALYQKQITPRIKSEKGKNSQHKYQFIREPKLPKPMPMTLTEDQKKRTAKALQNYVLRKEEIQNILRKFKEPYAALAGCSFDQLKPATQQMLYRMARQRGQQFFQRAAESNEQQQDKQRPYDMEDSDYSK